MRTFRIGNIEVSDRRFKDIKINAARKACRIFGEGWRLPTEIEMAGIFELLNYLGDDKRIGGFGDPKNDLMYWTSEGSVIDLKRGGIYNIDTLGVKVNSIMVRDI
jgi:hypothetical protein